MTIIIDSECDIEKLRYQNKRRVDFYTTLLNSLLREKKVGKGELFQGFLRKKRGRKEEREN